MILPTLMMGAMFPLVTAIWTPDAERAGRGVGAAYAINTGGTIFGALSGGLFILPWLGIHSSVLLAAGLYLTVAIAFWLIANTGVNRTRQFAIAGIATVAVAVASVLIPPWDRAVMISGAFSRPALINSILQRQPDKSLKQIVDDYELLYYDEGPEATVAVRRKKGSVDNQRTLVINGKADASSAGDMPTQILLAQLPMALRPRAEDALVIGLGSGITAGSLLTSTILKNITILEISDEVVEASAFFAPENYNVLSDPRVSLATADARNYLMAAPQRYDLIISEPSNPWLSGIANLFTDEFLQLAKSRLKPGGIMTQWFHIYSMSDEDLRTMLKTFDNNFEYVSVWRIQVGDLALIGSDQPHALSLRHAAGSGASELARADIHNDRDLVGTYIFGGERLSRYVVGARINSDRTPIVEFSAPKNLYSRTEEQNIGNIVDYLQGVQQAVPAIDMVWRTADYLHAPFMSLRIAGAAEDPVQIGARWLIDRRKVQVAGGFTDGLGSERLLSWTEGDSRYQVRAVLIADAAQAPSLDDLLQQLMRSTGRQGGKTTLADGKDAIWLSSAAAGGPKLQLDVAWDCAGDGAGFSRYGLQATLVEPGSDAPAALVSRLVRRFSCDSAIPDQQPAN
jgi:spermidine synthase